MLVSADMIENFWDVLYNKVVVVDDNAPVKFRPGDGGAIISFISSDQELLIEFGDGKDLQIPIRFLTLQETKLDT